VLGGFLAVALSVAFAYPGISAAGAATLPHGASPASAHASNSAAIHLLVPRPPHGTPALGSGNLINHGGPVENAPRVFIDFWHWGSDPSGERAYLDSFLGSIGGTSWLSTVAQYGGGWTGNLLAGTWSDSATIPSHPTDSQIQAEAGAAISHFGTGTSVNVEIVVATPTGHSTSGFGTQWCAYHGAVSAHHNVTYTNLPYMTDAGASCGENSVNGGSGGTLDGVSIVEGHELAETITDPLLNAWYDSAGYEIGDKCAWINLANITTSGGRFAMQPLWSNSARGCVM
jgi:serine protease